MVSTRVRGSNSCQIFHCRHSEVREGQSFKNIVTVDSRHAWALVVPNSGLVADAPPCLPSRRASMRAWYTSIRRSGRPCASSGSCRRSSSSSCSIVAALLMRTLCWLTSSRLRL